MLPLRLLVALVAGAVSSIGCTCGKPLPCQQVGKDAVIFVGWVLDPGGVGPTRFLVQRSILGLATGQFIVGLNAMLRTSCGVNFVRGKRYLVYARRGDNGGVFTSACMGSDLVEQATEDLRYLDAFVAGKTQSTIQGSVYADTPAGLTEERHRLTAELKTTKITAIRTDGLRYETTALSGEFRIHPVEPGAYTILATHPRFRASQTARVTVPEKGCAASAFSMGLDGKISGRLQGHDGKPPLQVPVHLLREPRIDRHGDVFETESSPSGVFEFNRIPPGRYRVAVNAEAEPSRRVPYPRTMSPVIDLAEAGTRSGVVLRLPSDLPPRTIRARVTWPDGQPAQRVTIWGSLEGYTPLQHQQTDDNGEIVFKTVGGRPFLIGAAAPVPYERIPSRQGVSANLVSLPPGGPDSTHLMLSIAPRKTSPPR